MLTSLSCGRSTPGDRRRGQRLDVELGNLARVLDPHRGDRRLGELAGEQAELLGKLDVGLELRRVLGGDRREVDCVGDGAGQQIVRHLLGDLQRDVLLRLCGGGAQMRRADDVVHAEQRVLLRRLGEEHVERRAGDVAASQCRCKGCLVDKAAARAVDDAHALPGLGQRRRVEDVAGLLGQRRVQRDEVGPPQQDVEINLAHAEVFGALLGQERVIGEDFHPEAQRALGDDRADVAATDHAKRLGGDLDPHELGLLPLAGLRRPVGQRDLPGQRQHQCDRVLGGGDRVAEGRVHHDDALGGGGLDVDVVDANAGAADHLQLVGLGDQLLGDLGRRADGEAVIVADDLLELVLGKAGLHVDGDTAILEDLHGCRRQVVGDQYAGSGVGGHGVPRQSLEACVMRS